MLSAWFQSELVPVVVHNSKITRYIVTLYSGACLLDRRDDDCGYWSRSASSLSLLMGLLAIDISSLVATLP